MNADILETARQRLSPMIDAFSQNPSIHAIALSGSSTGTMSDTLSDYDVYIYANGDVSPSWREATAAKLAERSEVNQQFFEPADDWILPESNQLVELMYRSLGWIEEQVDRVWIRGEASLGYTTCFVYNVSNSQILYDRDNWFEALREKTKTPYPEVLRRNIIAKNLPMLHGKMSSSYDEQIHNAVQRDDIVSINHRISAFVASYFDILFAVNRLLHPGEKRLIRFSLENCRILPPSFPHNLETLLTCPNSEKARALGAMVQEMHDVVRSGEE